MGDTLTTSEAVDSAPALAPFLVEILGYDDLLAERTRLHPLNVDAVVVGRVGSTATIAVEDRRVSSRHATILLSGSACVLRDEGSRNGSFVNGQRVETAPLADGDLVEIGHTLFCFRRFDATAMRTLAAAEPALRIGPTRTYCAELALLLRRLDRVAPTTDGVLILGETGAGKEIAAQTVHERSGRRGPFRAVDCGSVPETIFEATFFGSRRGAFTGAIDRPGEIVLADGGTLFLDEVFNLSLAAQAKLLRVIETREVTSLGSTAARAVDVRWIAATNGDVTNADRFRPDLLHRLGACILTMPPLRRRREDLGVLTAHLLREAGVTRASIEVSVARALFGAELPGNIRQLGNLLRTAARLADGGHIQSLPPELPSVPAETAPSPRARRAAPEREQVERALSEARGHVAAAARRLGTNPKQVYRWIERFAIDMARFRS